MCYSAENQKRIDKKKKDKFKPQGSLGAEFKRAKANKFYKGIKKVVKDNSTKKD